MYIYIKFRDFFFVCFGFQIVATSLSEQCVYVCDIDTHFSLRLCDIAKNIITIIIYFFINHMILIFIMNDIH